MKPASRPAGASDPVEALDRVLRKHPHALAAPKSALALGEELKRGRSSISTGCPGLDRVLGGGFPRRGLTEVCGEASVGKTQLMLQMLVQAQLPEKQGGAGGAACYVSTEGRFQIERLRGILAARAKKGVESGDGSSGSKASAGGAKDGADKENQGAATTLDRIFLCFVDTEDEFDRLLEVELPHLVKRRGVRLVVIDSIAAVYRADFAYNEGVKRASSLFGVASRLRRLGDVHGCCIIIVNQVSDVLDRAAAASAAVAGYGRDYGRRTRGRLVVPALGLAWANCISTRIMVTRGHERGTGGGVRTMHVIFAPHLPQGTCKFRIDSAGCVDV